MSHKQAWISAHAAYMTWPKARAQARVQRHSRLILLPPLLGFSYTPGAQVLASLTSYNRASPWDMSHPAHKSLAVPYRSKAKGLAGQAEPSGLAPAGLARALLSASVAGTVSRCRCSSPVLRLCTPGYLCLKCLSLICPGQLLQLIRTQPTAWVMLSGESAGTTGSPPPPCWAKSPSTPHSVLVLLTLCLSSCSPVCTLCWSATSLRVQILSYLPWIS